MSSRQPPKRSFHSILNYFHAKTDEQPEPSEPMRQCLAQGTCHQSDLVGGGSQCTCVALAFLCLESGGFTHNYCSQLIDQIVLYGTELYRSICPDISVNKYLMVHELPDHFALHNASYATTKYDAYSGLIGTTESVSSSLTFTVEDALRSSFAASRSCLLTLGPNNSAFTSALCRSPVGDQFICFDAHSRSTSGVLSVHGKAVAVLIKSMAELVVYIRDLAKSLFGKERSLNIQFELTPILCTHTLSDTDAGRDNATASAILPNTTTTTHPADSINTSNPNDDEIDQFGKRMKIIVGDNNDELCPSVCTLSQFQDWKGKRPWVCAIRCDEGSIGIYCKVCYSAKILNKCLSSTERLQVSKEWVTGIAAKSSKKLHDKMTDHEKSKAHVMCCKVEEMKSEERIEKSLSKSSDIWLLQNAQKLQLTSRVFRTCYLVAWKHLSFKVYPYLYEVQQQNGLDMGKMLFSDHSCRNIITFIGDSMRKKLVSYILQSDTLFSILMDESTTMANQTVLIVYIRTLDHAGVAQNSFLTLCELSGTTGKDIAEQLLKSLLELGFSKEILFARLLGFCTDGASSLQGIINGALELFGALINRSDLIKWHCMNHKMELAVHDAVQTTNKVSHFRMFMDTLYAYYSRSPKNCRLLHAASEELGEQFRKIGKVFDVRWVSSSYNTVNAVFSLLPALTLQFRQASTDMTSPSKERAKALGMAKKIQSFAFITELALLKDVLTTLKHLSLYLESRSASILDAKGHLDTTVQTLNALKTADGLTLLEFRQQLAANGKFNGIEVSRTNDDENSFELMRLQFVQALLDNLLRRFPDRLLLDAGAVLSPSSWPDDRTERALFGDREVVRMAGLCHLDSAKALGEFREYKNNTKVVGEVLSCLLNRIGIIPISSAECERGFSCMNINNTDVRSCLKVETLCSLIFIKVNGPSPCQFKPDIYVAEWLKSGHHASSDAPTGKTSKIKTVADSAMAVLYK